MIRRARIPFAILPLITAAAAPSAHAQFRELELRRVIIDHDQDSTFVTTDGELIPAGWGFAARALFLSGGVVQVEASGSLDTRPGVVCGGFIQDPVLDCVPEQVRYSGGLAAVSLGWRGHAAIGARSTIGVLPRLGAGWVWRNESGRDTNRSMGEARFSVVMGLSVEVGYLLPQRDLTLTGSVGADRLRPIWIERCEDCSIRIRDPLYQYTFGVGVSWRRWRTDVRGRAFPRRRPRDTAWQRRRARRSPRAPRHSSEPTGYTDPPSASRSRGRA